ncbi:hypothetical protein AAG906_026911 [Vitis piasezkii]
MESPPFGRYTPKSKKRVFVGSSSSVMDPEVVEIKLPALISQSSDSKKLKQKEVNHHEIIDIDIDEDSSDLMIIDEKVDRHKGKAIKNVSDGYFNYQAKDAVTNNHASPTTAVNLESLDGFPSSKSFAPGVHSSINIDGFVSDLSYDDDDNTDIYSDDFMDDDEYAILQAHFDNVDIPPGVEAPIPWLPVSARSKKKSSSTANISSYVNKQTQPIDLSLNQWFPEPAQFKAGPTSVNGTSSQIQVDAVSQLPKLESSSSWLYPEAGQIKKKPNPFAASTYSSSLTQMGTANHSTGLEQSTALQFLGPTQRKKMPTSANGSHNSETQLDNLDAVNFLPEWTTWGSPSPVGVGMKKPASKSSSSHSSFHAQTGSLKMLPGAEQFPYWWPSPPISSISNKEPSFMGDPAFFNFYDPFDPAHIVPEEDADYSLVLDHAGSPKSANATAAGSSAISSETIPNRGKGRNKDDILNKFLLFKQFDTVQDHSDHHYSCNGSSHTQPSKNWAKKIQEEWKILEKDLPDTISVRVYETRIDLLRAVIVGAEGTPYHDGLFFFDVFFPVDYPNAPPLVHYRSGGLRLNPNLYDNGKVCLSLLNTWSGDQNEKWIPGLSTMLQVLVSIQGLILNAKPFFNEPGFACMSGSASGEKRSLQYNENTFILSLKTMLYSMKKPPRHFEDFVLGHFCKHAHDILVACKAYMDGAQVGCLVKGGVQDVDEGDKSCSKRFKDNLAVFNNLLVKTFTNIGATGCEKFLTKEPEKPPPPERLNRRAGKSLKGVIIAS